MTNTCLCVLDVAYVNSKCEISLYEDIEVVCLNG